jgi:anthraniloyl-CoA monooxygenase
MFGKHLAGLGFDRMDQAEAIALCERSSPNISTASRCSATRAPARLGGVAQVPPDHLRDLAHDKLILLGDAAHTAHFSIGSGTKLALEDAIKLAEVLNRPASAGSRRWPNIRPSEPRGAQAAE